MTEGRPPVLVGDEHREPVVEVTEHRKVGWRAHVEPNGIVVERRGVAVGGVDLVGEDYLDAFLRLVAEDGRHPGRGPFGDRQDPPSHQPEGLGVVDLEMLALDRSPAPREVLGLGPSLNRPQKTKQTSHCSRRTGHL
jgi:hypothetical protein